MWLLHVRTRELVHFMDDRSVIGKYAILSHTWEDEEVSFTNIKTSEAHDMMGYRKIDYTCRQAEADDLEYVWVDTCCINKDSSAELSESINSMYRWYYNAKICYAYISDFESESLMLFEDDGDAFITSSNSCEPDSALFSRDGAMSRWLTRGWTLQELIAPLDVCFFDRNWRKCGTRQSLRQRLATVTKIDECLLTDRDRLGNYSIATRLSWAASRMTTRQEDEAYSLLGILDINMPLLYGEGSRAFKRLQEEVIKVSTDQSIFAWAPELPEDSRMLLAPNCRSFRHSRDVKISARYAGIGEGFELANVGLRIRLETLESPDDELVHAALECFAEEAATRCIYLKLRRIPPRYSQSATSSSVYEVARNPWSRLDKSHHRALSLEAYKRERKDVVIVRDGELITVCLDIDPNLQLERTSRLGQPLAISHTTSTITLRPERFGSRTSTAVLRFCVFVRDPQQATANGLPFLVKLCSEGAVNANEPTPVAVWQSVALDSNIFYRVWSRADAKSLPELDRLPPGMLIFQIVRGPAGLVGHDLAAWTNTIIPHTPSTWAVTQSDPVRLHDWE
ncbi:unnamed protein product [Zymoseptoria tritici ST99CH_1A5]|nr:unnamed protein product [Zymoseptoria tritici ST99CH_1A5]